MTAALEARHLVVVREGRRILDDVSLAIGPGEVIAVRGPSGSGKSTLVRSLATLEPLDGGEVLLGGAAVSPCDFRRRVAFLAQQPAMFARTVRDNLAMGPALHGRPLDDARGAALLDAVGLAPSFLEREARTLSGGEKQRVALGRALANDPEVLLLDEPTAALDPETGARIVQLLVRLAGGGRSLLMVTHVEEHARALGGRQLRCEQGRLFG
jgi:putative ABC transport system ATP-binding protein